MSEFSPRSENVEPQTLDLESERKLETARVETIGHEDPRLLTKEQFDKKAWLYHAARNPNFRVESSFDYSQDLVDGATLGCGLYVTASKEQADGYAQIRPGATTFKLLPHQAHLLNLTASHELVNLSFPKEIVAEWIDYAKPKIMERAQDAGTQWFIQHRLFSVLKKMNELPSKSLIDLRSDILDTGNSPFSIIDDIWQAFCALKGWDGIIFVEGGEDHFSRNFDRTYAIYNASKIGTYDDWQQRRTQAKS